jgi:hypothetical protein
MECTCTTSGKTSIIVPQPSQNVLLSLLNPETAERIYPHLHLVPMELGQVLYEPGDTMKNVFFPIDCIVSLLYVMESGASAEISVVGKEGMVCSGQQKPDKVLDSFSAFAGGKPLLYACGLTQL